MRFAAFLAIALCGCATAPVKPATKTVRLTWHGIALEYEIPADQHLAK